MVPQAHRRQAGTTAAHLFVKQPLFIQSTHLACYLAREDEFDSQPLIKAIWEANKQCYLPLLTAEKSLHFVPYAPGDALRTNQYLILEPTHPAKPIALQQLDIVFAPLLAFDAMGHRLGAGGGYYDRTFAEHRPFMIGLAYAQQEAKKLPVDSWDVSLDGVLTEQGYRAFER
jgi:5-formyltetrahydrofolate cyclo-ligase